MRWPYVLLTVLYCAGIWWLSSKPDPPQPGFSFPGMDKAAHLLIFGGLAAVVSMGIRRSNPEADPQVRFWVPIAFVAFYGMVDEFHQALVPDRTPSALDWVADVTGAVLVQFALYGGLVTRALRRAWP